MVSSRLFRAAAAATLLSVVLVGCGEGDDGDDVQAYCDLSAELDEQEGDVTADQADEIDDLAPDEISDEISFVVERLKEAIDEGDIEAAFGDPEVQERFESIEAFEAENCDNAESDTDDEEGSAGGADAGGGAEGDLTDYCDASLAIETVPEPEIDFESLSPEEQAEAAKTFATEELQPLADEVVAAAPEEVEEDLGVLVAALDEIAETGDFSVFETEETEAASTRLHEFDLDNCDWNTQDVTGVDFAFEGVPDTLDAGVTSFEFANEGEEQHELILFRKNDGVELSAEELLELPEEEAMAMTTFVGATFGAPGDEDYLVTDLEAGDYAMVCFIPVGTITEADFETAEGPPHFTQGMFAEFTVE